MVARVNRVIGQKDRRTPPPFWADVPSFTGFAEQVQSAMQGGELPFPQRQQLIRQAAQFGIRRFDANLIIALVQHRAGTVRVAAFEPAVRGGWSVPITVAVTLQAIIILALCLLFYGPR